MYVIRYYFGMTALPVLSVRARPEAKGPLRKIAAALNRSVYWRNPISA